MTLVNRQTGEAVIEGTEVRIVFTLEAISYVESQTHKRIMELWSEIAEGKVGLGDLVALVTAGMEGYRRRSGAPGGQTNPAKAAKAIDNGGGIRKVYPQVYESLTHSATLGLVDDEDADEEGEQGVDPTNGPSSSAASPEQEWPRLASGT